MRYLALGTRWVARRAALSLAIMVGSFAPALAWAQSADVFVTKTGNATVDAGSNLTYNITVFNAGPDDADNVSISDTLPAGTLFVTASQTGGPAFSCTTPPVGSGGTVTCDVALLPALAPATFSLTVLVPADAASGLVGTNTATVTSTTPDPDTANNSSSVTTTVATSADLFVTKTGAPTVTAGTNLIYTITVGNPGPSDAQAVVVSDPLPAGTLFVTASQTAGPVFTCTTPPVGSGGTVTCDLATLPAFASATFSLTILVPADAPSGLVGTNTATVASTTADPDPATNTSSVSTTVATSADLFVLKAGAPTVTAGSNLTYTITVGNPGPSDAQAVVVSDPLPAGRCS